MFCASVAYPSTLAHWFPAHGHGRSSMKPIEVVAPTEDVGRDTISRFDMQFQAAAYAALEILEGNGIDCVYCDYHDDFVVRRQHSGITSYHFFQVKTKKKLNDQWTLAEIFAYKKRGQKSDATSLAKIRTSFAGKLLIHGIVFDTTCAEVTLLSNVYFNDEVIATVDELRGKTPNCNAAKFLADNFSAIFTLSSTIETSKVADLLSKLSLRPAVNYIGLDSEVFANATRAAIFKYSEIDLDFYETKELANGLVDLVYRKSKTPLTGVGPGEIASHVGVGLDDLLEVLSISRSAYDALLNGVEGKALKAASVIQRWLKNAGATDAMVEFASQQKVNWDIWHRTARHIYAAFDLALLLDRLDKLFDRWTKSGSDFQSLHALLVEFSSDPFALKFDLTRDLIFGAVCAIAVRRNSR